LAAKFRVVANGCDTSEFARLGRPSPVERPFTLLHAGSLYAGRTPAPLFRALRSAIDRGIIDPREFRVRFLGAVALQSSPLIAVLTDLGLTEVVEFSGRVPRAESLRAMMTASALLLLQPGHGIAVPAKLYEYLAAGRPILAIAEGETAAIVQSSGAGAVAASDDEDGIVIALEDVMRRAAQAVSPVPASMYDGALRAALIGSVISEVLRPAAGGREIVMQSADGVSPLAECNSERAGR
jgi:glycosyltransferase involved in cell wall biosynthesis